MKQTKLITELTIKRNEWGVGHQGGQLLGDDGKKCCLGFFCLAAGVPKDKISCMGMPADIIGYDFYPKLAPLVNFKKVTNKSITNRLVKVNDSTTKRYANPAKREARIAELFGQIGVTVEFTGQYEE